MREPMYTCRIDPARNYCILCSNFLPGRNTAHAVISWQVKKDAHLFTPSCSMGSRMRGGGKYAIFHIVLGRGAREGLNNLNLPLPRNGQEIAFEILKMFATSRLTHK